MLTASSLAHLETVSRTLLSPLASPDVDTWRAETLRASRSLLGADRGMFMLSTADRAHYSDDLDGRILGAFDHHVAEHTPHGPRLSDTVMQTWLDARRRSGQEVITNALADDLIGDRGIGLRDSPIYNEAMAPGGFRDQRTLYVSFSGGEAMLQLGYAQADRAPDHDASVALLRVLLPSFKAGLETLARLGAHRKALDVVSEPLVAFDADAREVHRNPALVQLLSADPSAQTVEWALRLFADDLRRLAFPKRGQGPAVPAPMQRDVATPRGRYTLRATLLPAGALGLSEVALVSVSAETTPAFPSPAVIRERFGLTTREADVALLVAEGLTTAAIADRLFVSAHTARHHVENVLSKMGLRRRSAVAATLLVG